VARRGGPVGLSLTRQKLTTLAGTAELARAGVARGGYVLREAGGGPGWTAVPNRPAGVVAEPPDLILLATGSELQLAMTAARTLEADGIGTRVVSLPCWELFEQQDDAYRSAVLPPLARRRVAIETGSPLGWDRWVGDEGAVIGLDHFGTSAPAGEIFAHFGFTAERVADVGRRVVRDGLRGWQPTLESGHLPALGPDGAPHVTGQSAAHGE